MSPRIRAFGVVFIVVCVFASQAERTVSLQPLSGEIFLETDASELSSTSLSSRSYEETSAALELRLLSWNIWESLERVPDGLESAREFVIKMKPDILAIQEATPQITQLLAEAVGPEYIAIPEALLIVRSNYTVLKTFPYDIITRASGIILEPRKGVLLRVFNVHLIALPYGPYDLRADPGVDVDFFPSWGSSVTEVQRNSEESQGQNVKAIMDLWVEHPQHQPHLPTIFMGDFNCPSHLDHTEKVCSHAAYNAARNYPCVPIVWAPTKRMEDHGFIDTFREAHPNVIANEASYGFTWTPRSTVEDTLVRLPAKFEVHDRIDFIYYRPSARFDMKTVHSFVASDYPSKRTYPSDHCAVLTRLQISPRDLSVPASFSYPDIPALRAKDELLDKELEAVQKEEAQKREAWHRRHGDNLNQQQPAGPGKHSAGNEARPPKYNEDIERARMMFGKRKEALHPYMGFGIVRNRMPPRVSGARSMDRQNDRQTRLQPQSDRPAEGDQLAARDEGSLRKVPAPAANHAL